MLKEKLDSFLKISIFIFVLIIAFFASKIGANRAYCDDSGLQKRELIPIYILWNGKTEDHIATTDIEDLKLNSQGWNYEGIIGYIYNIQQPGTIPLYRYYNDKGKLKDHYWTTDESFKRLAPIHGYHYEMILGYIYKTQQPDTVPLYQFYSKTRKDHFTTTAFNFFQYAKEFGDYDYIGIEGYIFTKKNKE